MIKITHLVHAGFLIENDEERLIIDPADSSFGYEIKNEVVNYLLVSHEHMDHNNTENIKVIDNKGSFIIDKIQSYHDSENGKLRGTNIIHVIETTGTRICHLGDLGHKLNEDQIKQIGHIDVLLIPVGGTYTIDYMQAIEVVSQLNPNIIIPMHYKTDKWGKERGIDSVDKFIENIKDYSVIKTDSNKLEYNSSLQKGIYII